MKLALTLPDGNKINPPDLSATKQGVFDKKFTDLSSVLSSALEIVFYLAIFLAFYYLIWGSFAYIMAQGKKEDLQKARARITWALIGMIIILLSYSLAKYASEIFNPLKGGLPF